MKKYIVLFLCLVLVFTLSACKNTPTDTGSESSDIIVEEIIVGGNSSSKDEGADTSNISSEGNKDCAHKFEAATCEAPKTCSKCGATTGKALGHIYTGKGTDAKCARCGAKKVAEHRHDYSAVTCEKAATCSICGATAGNPIGHYTNTPNCEAYSYCLNCKENKADPIGHTYSKATCVSPERCKNCGKTRGKALGHYFEGGKCMGCGITKDKQLTAVYLGDSTAYGDKDDPRGRSWCGRIEDTFGIKGTNVAACGWSLSTVREPIVNELSKAPKDTDYIILQGGGNDITALNLVLGEVSPVGTTQFDTTTVAGAMEDLIKKTFEHNPNARVGFVIKFDCEHYENWDKFVKLAKAVCDKWNIPYLDLSTHQEFLSEFDMKAHMADVAHPNAAGYDVIAKYIGEWMQTF